MKDSLGDRIKRYERVSDHMLTPGAPLFIRVDGRAFHTWTKGLDKPFDRRLMHTMINTAMDVRKDMPGFKLAYLQSDECTFMLTDYDRIQSQGWFDYRLNKVVSIAASAFTAYFNREIPNQFSGHEHQLRLTPAMFDARAFTVPYEDAPNVFVWREKDWNRNSLSMLAHCYYTTSELKGKKRADMHEMLHAKGENWASLDPIEKNGTFLHADGSVTHEYLVWSEIAELIDL
jgi:tRNA(His) guanylyltransferase